MHKRSLKCNWFSVLLAFGFTVTSYSQQCESHWSDQFPATELDSIVIAMTFFDDGSDSCLELYIGGSFDKGGEVVLNGIAKLNGDVWAPLGGGVSGHTAAMTVFNDGSGNGPELYVAGTFSSAGGIEANNISKWDGKAWTTLGKGLNGSATAMIVFNDGTGPALFVGGWFIEAGGMQADYVAKWDGITWSPLGDGLNGAARAFAIYDDGLGAGEALYVGGNFSKAGSVEAHNLARWEGSSWSAVEGGTDGPVQALEVLSDENGSSLYVGGFFSTAGSISVSNIAQWDGIQWSSLGNGLNHIVVALIAYDDDSEQGPALYAGGFFQKAGEVQANRIAKWDGESWSSLGSGVSSSVWSLASSSSDSTDESKLYVGGHFKSAGEIYSPSFAMWDGANWSTTGNGMVSEDSIAVVRDLELFDDKLGDGEQLYAAGSFSTAGGIAAKSIAKFNGSEWSSVGDGISGEDSSIYDLTSFDDGSGESLYAGGQFQFAGDKPANNIAKWNAENWSPLGEGTDGSVHVICVYDDKLGQGAALYAGGNFNNAGDMPASNIAKWDGTNWSALGKGIYNDEYNFSEVWSMIAFDDGSAAGETLYVGGEFKNAGDVEASHIARWDGVQWSGVGEGLDEGENSTVFALVVYDDGNGPALYAVGTFYRAGPIIVQGIAKWDGTKWSSVMDSSGFSGGAFTATVFEGNANESAFLVVGGEFSMAEKVEVNAIVKFDGKVWSPLGSGLDTIEQYTYPIVWSVKEFDDKSGTGPALFVGGEFEVAGGNSSENIAKWIVCDSQIPGDIDGDGSVNTSDLLILLSNWGPCDDCKDCVADLDENCSVGTSDLLILLSNWG